MMLAPRSGDQVNKAYAFREVIVDRWRYVPAEVYLSHVGYHTDGNVSDGERTCIPRSRKISSCTSSQSSCKFPGS